MGTLITLRHSVGHSYAALAREHGIALAAEAIDAVFPTIYRQAPPLAFGPLSAKALLAAERDWWGERIVETFAALGASPPDVSLQHDLFAHFARPEQWRIYPDAEGRLERWRRWGLKLAVVSNFDSRLHTLLAELGLTPWLDAVVISSETGAAKPDPRPFARALAALKLEPWQAWHIGDSPEDLAGARAAGVRCITVQRSP